MVDSVCGSSVMDVNADGHCFFACMNLVQSNQYTPVKSTREDELASAMAVRKSIIDWIELHPTYMPPGHVSTLAESIEQELAISRCP
jgi:hypothetical protein